MTLPGKKIAIMQPYFLPYIGYWQLMNAVDEFIIYDDVSYINRGWINRNRIILNNNPQYITIPLLKASQNKLINEIDIDHSQNWQRNILRTIQHGYSKAPHYNSIYPIVEKLLLLNYSKCSQLITMILKEICCLLSIDTVIFNSSEKVNNIEEKGQSRIIDICAQLDANIYINPIGGRELYDRNAFLSKGIELFFLQPHDFNYEQISKGEFMANFSIIDILMHCGIEETKSYLNKYSLVTE